MSLPSRKHPRLRNYDYGQCGCYHITICTQDRIPFLSSVVPPITAADRATIVLTSVGEIADRYIRRIPDVYAGVDVLKYVIMPNHIHLLLLLGPQATAPVPTIIRSLKRMIRRDAPNAFFQDSYYDVIIRNDVMFRCEWSYIDSNPDKWEEDKLFCRE